MKLVEDKEVLLLDLLDTICERFPSDRDDPDDEGFAPDQVSVICPRHGEHLVHPAGFRLLELAEGKMGTMALHEVVYCHIKDLWKFQDELSERVRRQQRPVPYCFGDGKLKFNISAFNLLKRCNDWYVTTITGLRSEEDWMLLSNLLRPGKGHIARVADIDIHSVRSARRSDLELVWLSVVLV